MQWNYLYDQNYNACSAFSSTHDNMGKPECFSLICALWKAVFGSINVWWSSKSFFNRPSWRNSFHRSKSGNVKLLNEFMLRWYICCITRFDVYIWNNLGGGNNNTRNVKQRGNSGVWRRTNPFLHTKTIQFDAMWINMQEIENTANIYLLTKYILIKCYSVLLSC